MVRFAALLSFVISFSSMAVARSGGSCEGQFERQTLVVDSTAVDAMLFRQLEALTKGQDRIADWTAARMAHLGLLDGPAFYYFSKFGGFVQGASGHYAEVAFAMVIRQQADPKTVFRKVVIDGFQDGFQNFHNIHDSRRHTLWYLHQFLLLEGALTSRVDRDFNRWEDKVLRAAIKAWDRTEAKAPLFGR